jgi:hypothetical protein
MGIKMGEALIKKICEETHLPMELILGELTNLIEKSGVDPKNVTMDQLRIILASYLQDTLLAAKSHQAPKN